MKEFSYPATLYLTTYYVDIQVPVVPGIWRYMLWKSKRDSVDVGEFLGKSGTLDLSNSAGRIHALRQMTEFADIENLDGEQRDGLSLKLARALGLDYAAICQSRIIQLLRPQEVRDLAGEGLSVQMHMHHHFSPPSRESYLQNLGLNHSRIKEMTGSDPKHFCYPSGSYTPENVVWLRDQGVYSATTCDLGLSSAKSDPLMLPRLIDTSFISDLAFESWLVGIGALISRAGALVPRR